MLLGYNIIYHAVFDFLDNDKERVQSKMKMSYILVLQALSMPGTCFVAATGSFYRSVILYPYSILPKMFVEAYFGGKVLFSA